MAIQNFKIDQAATFAGVVFLSCEPKTKFGSDQQDTLKDGTPKWQLQVLGAFHNFGRQQNEVINVGVAAHSDPAAALQPYTPVELVGFEVGVMERTKRNPETGEEKVIGVTVWYRAESVRSTAATGSKGKAGPATVADPAA